MRERQTDGHIYRERNRDVKRDRHIYIERVCVCVIEKKKRKDI